MELVLRFVLGGAIVSLFAAVGEVWKPKTFAGIFGSAPSVALATLGIAFATHDGPWVAIACRSMIAGSVGLAVYGAACAWIARRGGLPIWLGALAAWGTWGAATAAVWLAARHLGGGA